MVIASKEQNLKLWKAGCFGNTLRTWDSVSDALEDHSYHGPYTVRSRHPDFDTIFGIPNRTQLRERVQRDASIMFKCGRGHLYVNEAMPEHLITIQGEVRLDNETTFLPYMFYSHLKDHMKVGLRTQPKHLEGAAVRVTLEYYLGQYAQKIWDLFEEFPDHSIEFSAFEEGLGTLGWPLVIWEVRSY